MYTILKFLRWVHDQNQLVRRLMELDKVLNVYCYSEFHASCEAIIRQQPKVTVTIKDIEKTEQ